MDKHIDWKQAAAVSLTVALWGAGLYLLFRYALVLVLPFLLALAVSALVRPIAAGVAGHLHLNRKFCAFVTTLVLLGLLILLLVFACNRVWSECTRLLEWLGEAPEGEGAMTRMVEWFRGLGDRVPLFRRLQRIEAFDVVFERVDELVSAALTGLVSEISAQIPAMAGSIASAMPSVFLFAVTFLLSCFYFSADDGRISSFFVRFLPRAVSEKLREMRPRVKGTALKYLRAYLLLMAITFGEVFIGFLILGMPYAFLPALLTAVVDLLPVFGTGTVLVPWAVFRLLGGDYYTGFGLLILYGVTLLVRQIIEPHIVGGSLGLHPLATLFSMYVGYRLIGFFGLLLGPAVALVVRTVFFPERTETGTTGEDGGKPALAERKSR